MGGSRSKDKSGTITVQEYCGHQTDCSSYTIRRISWGFIRLNGVKDWTIGVFRQPSVITASENHLWIDYFENYLCDLAICDRKKAIICCEYNDPSQKSDDNQKSSDLKVRKQVILLNKSLQEMIECCKFEHPIFFIYDPAGFERMQQKAIDKAIDKIPPFRSLSFD
jgi:hypothetical protein